MKKQNYRFVIGIFLTTLSMVQLSAQQPCVDSPEYSQLDFWIGSWRVETPNGQLAGHSRIEKILDGCVVLENWEGNGKSKGKSFNYYNTATLSWHQKWVDNFGQPLEFEGVVIDDVIVYKGNTVNVSSKVKVLQEMTLKKIRDDEVHQIWRQSQDKGESWAIVFDGIYKRINPVD